MDIEKLSDKPFIKQKRILIAVIIVLAAIIALLLLKPPLPKAPPPPPLPERLPNGPDMQKTTDGKVVAYKYNQHFDVNAITVKSSKANLITIDFLPHTASAVMKIAGIGEAVSLTYSLLPNDESVGYQLKEIANIKTGATAKLNDLPPPPRIPDHAAQNFDITNPLLVTDDYGGIVALKKDSLLFHFKPGLVDDIMPLIKTTKHFNLMAVSRDDYSGFVNFEHDKVYIVISITIDNKTFLVR